MSDPGPPERRPVVGWRTPGAVLWSFSEYALFATLTRPQPTPRAARGPIQRPSRPATQWYRPRRPRPIATIRQNTAAAMAGEAITSGMLYLVTPISLRMSYCQYCPSPNETANRTPALTQKAVHAQCCGRRGPRSANARQIDAAHTPSPYPIAAVMPVTTPWRRPPRGSSDG